MALFGTDNTATSGPRHLSTQTAALVATVDDISGTNGFASSVSKPTLQITVANPNQDVFVGVGPKDAVNQYLAGVAIENIRDFSLEPFRLSTVVRTGSTQPAAPANESFWTAHASGRQATLDWKITDGSYQVVVMNADAAPSVAVDGRFALTIPHLFAVGIGLLVAGIVILAGGIVLLVVGIRMHSRPGPTAATADAGAPGQQ